MTDLVPQNSKEDKTSEYKKQSKEENISMTLNRNFSQNVNAD